MTRRERFLTEMDPVMPWAELLALIAPYDPHAGRERGDKRDRQLGPRCSRSDRPVGCLNPHL